MKTILKSTLYFAFLLSLLPFFGCGGDDDEPEIPLKGTLLGEFQFPRDASGPLWQVSDADITELLNLDVPSNWAWIDIDKKTYQKYYHAQLLKQFGDIPEIRYLIAYYRHPGEKTRAQIIAKSEALYRLFPGEENLSTLQETISITTQSQPSSGRDADEWMAEDPEEYMAAVKVYLLRKYGDIPEVHTYVSLELKRLLGEKLTEEEREARNSAALYLINLDKQDEADE